MTRYTIEVGSSSDYETTRRDADNTGAHLTVTVEAGGGDA